jgi:ABC-2 type transport system ATP-binding protein
MGEPAVHVADLRRTFKVPEREAGLRASVRSLFRRRYREVRAVDGISFTIEPGEIVGFLGPNGAGKTTTLKMLAGLLHPTGGEVRVLAETPSRRRPAYLRRMSLVMGNRNQLQWDLPAADSFELNRAIYQVPRPEFRSTRDELVDLLELGELVTKPVRNLSLGERMKVELAAALLHRPEVLFLDEPTLGLDITMQKRIRGFVAEYNRRHAASVLLTSHYMADVEALCQRVIVIDHGRILFDGDLATLSSRLAAYKEVGVTLAGADADLSAYGEIRACDGDRVTLRVPKEQTPSVTARLLADHTVLDLTVEDPPIEDVIELLLAAVRPMPGSPGSP